MTTFEHATEILNSDHEKRMSQALQKRGGEGWELVAAVAVGLTHTRLFFKRPMVSDAEAV